jgi:hypothetical protein
MEWTWSEQLEVLSEEFFEKPSAFSIGFPKSLGFSKNSNLVLLCRMEK